MSRTSDISLPAFRINLKEVARISWEVGWDGVFQCGHFFIDNLEQRKAALRKVEIELDEADDIVRFKITHN